ncbi:uncharacterized protein PRCAT00002688001 [Priceomyces carsonii]|uniref:uncharacterized protein n=1 Tax=Priceomyces carsonii TaxID=28549 RepID=UPI002ED810A6|nr:unnamed protein product [Priceomyces carsonii]
MLWLWERQLVGEGVSGSVVLYLKKSRPSELYAVKEYCTKEKYESNEEYKDRVLHEYRVLKRLDHENFIKVFKYEISWTGVTIKVFMEAGFVNVKQIADKLQFEEALCLWRQLCEGVSYLHGQNYSHRDLKPENLILCAPQGRLKIIDMMTASECNEDAIGLVGSEPYCAPEMFSKLRYNGKKADVWSVGIILYFLINNELPWKSTHHSDPRFALYKSDSSSGDSKSKGAESKILGRFPTESRNLISHILTVNPDIRGSMESLYTDKWFNSITFCGSSMCGADHNLYLSAVPE